MDECPLELTARQENAYWYQPKKPSACKRPLGRRLEVPTSRRHAFLPGMAMAEMHPVDAQTHAQMDVA